MKKLKLFLAAAAAMLGVQTSFAQQEPVDGTVYYLYNVETGKFLTRGATWGTQAVTNDFGSPWKVSISDGKYTLQMYDLAAAGETNGLGDNGYSDNGSPIAFTPTGNATDGYKLQNGDKYLFSPATYGNNVLYTADENNTWQFLNPTQYAAVLAAKTATQEAAVATAAGIDISGSSLAAVVGNTDDYTATDMSSSVPFPSNSSWTRTGVANRGGNANDGTYGIERYQGGGTESYTVTGLTEGIYKVGVKAMFRSASNAACYTVGQAGYTNSSAYFSANGKLVQIKDWYSSCTSDSSPNGVDAFVTIANNGGYYAEVYTYVGSDGVLELKAVSESYWGASWFLFNGCTLTYYLDNSATIIVPENIALSQNSATLTTGSTLTLTGTVTPEDALDKSLTWSSSDETVATVDANGVVTALKAGTATITATANAATTVTATCAVTVADAAAPAFYSAIAAGDFYIQNVATGLFLSGGNDWGTHASIIEHGTVFTAAQISDGVYTLDSHIYNSATNHFVAGAYVDGAATNLYITSLGDGKYSISTADGSAFMTAKAASTVVDNTAANASSSLAQWYFVSKNDRDKTLAAATAANPVDATYYIPNAGFGRNQNTSYNENTWTVTASNSNLASNANCAESYHSTFNVTKTISLPNGTYKFRAQGFYRQDGSDNDNLPEFFVGDQTITFPLRTGTEGSMDAAATSFAAGSYYTDYVTVTVTDRTLTLGCRLETNTSLWCIWDNFELYMTGYTANTGITADIDEDEIEAGSTATITAATVPATASFNAITYSSSDETIATVDENGVVTGVGIGTATITVAATEMESFSTTINVTVKATAPTAFALSETAIALDETTTSATLTITPTPAAANTSATWASSDETIATVVDGVVTAVSSGTATITATSTVDPTVSASATVTVTFPETAVVASTYVNNGATRTVCTLGDNLIKNGAFEYPDNYYGWKNGAGGKLAAANFDIVTDGDNKYLKAKTSAGAGDANSISTGWPIEAGKTYVFGYKIKANNTGNSQYHVVSLTNTIGTESQKVSDDATPITTEWTNVEYKFTNTDYAYVQFRARWLASNQSYDDFYLQEVTSETTEGNVQYALDAIPTANIGTDAFQYSQDAIDAANALVQGTATVAEVEDAYEAVTTVNAPADGQLFNVILTYSGWTYDQKAMTYIANGRSDAGNYNIQYKEAANINLAQAFTFTKVSGNNYKMSQIDADGNARYISTGVPYSGNTSQIRTTTTADDALVVTVIPTATEGVWNLKNTEANNYIGSQDAGVYTVNSHIDFNIVETSKPSIAINTTAAGWGTTILPFAVAEIPEGVKVYSCAEASGATLTLVEVEALEANKPYIIEGAWNATLTGDAQGTALTYEEGLLVGTYSRIAAPNGSYILQKQGDKVGFFKVDTSVAQPNVPANRAYVKADEESGVKAFYLGGGEDAIQSVFDGLVNGDAYDLGGRKVTRLQKGGVYIVNGKKVIVK